MKPQKLFAAHYQRFKLNLIRRAHSALYELFIHLFHFYNFRRVTLQQSWFLRGSPLKRRKYILKCNTALCAASLPYLRLLISHPYFRLLICILRHSFAYTYSFAYHFASHNHACAFVAKRRYTCKKSFAYATHTAYTRILSVNPSFQ